MTTTTCPHIFHPGSPHSDYIFCATCNQRWYLSHQNYFESPDSSISREYQELQDEFFDNAQRATGIDFRSQVTIGNGGYTDLPTPSEARDRLRAAFADTSPITDENGIQMDPSNQPNTTTTTFTEPSLQMRPNPTRRGYGSGMTFDEDGWLTTTRQHGQRDTSAWGHMNIGLDEGLRDSTVTVSNTPRPPEGRYVFAGIAEQDTAMITDVGSAPDDETIHINGNVSHTEESNEGDTYDPILGHYSG